MKLIVLFMCVWLANCQDYTDDVTELCCVHGESAALPLSSASDCSSIGLPEYVEAEQEGECRQAASNCCREHFKLKNECTAGMGYAAAKRCNIPKTEVGKTCCDECSFGILSGESQGMEACGGPPDVDNRPITYLRKNTFYKCCVEAASKPETTTERKPPPTTSTTSTTTSTTQAPRQQCSPGACEQECDDSSGVIRCSCRSGFRLQGDRKSCKDVNECAEATENLGILCAAVFGYVCHNTPGSYKCVSIKKREVGLSCPPGFKWNLMNQVCDDYTDDVTELCCVHGESAALPLSSANDCSSIGLPEYVEAEQEGECRQAASNCCREHFKLKDECTSGMGYAAAKRCTIPKTEVGKTCCDECSFGILSGESQGMEACGGPPDVDNRPITYLRKNTFYKCCVEAASKSETTTERKPPPTTSTTSTTTSTTQAPRQQCSPGACEQECDDSSGVIRCSCRSGFRLQGDRKSCKDVNECAEATENLCIQDGYVCHNTPGSYKCVPIKKRDVGLSCPPGFKRNLMNQVCDDINECQLPRPPCPKYLCENTIGAYKCGGKIGTPVAEGVTEAAVAAPAAPKNDICPAGFRAGANDECVDIDECSEHVDDCQRLSQFCINTHGSFFCQDHVSKRCAPGFKYNAASGMCEDIDECEENTEACKRNQVCVNLPGAYDCKSKISTLPKLTTKKCQEGTRMRVGSGICEDIDECREGTHLCDHFQNCINTFGGHECRCKNGFELDSSSGSCVDVDECALKLDNCSPGLHCLNVLGSFTCTRRPPTTSTTSLYEYEYYDTDSEDNSTSEASPEPPKVNTTPQPAPTRPPTPRPTPPRPTPPRPTTPRPTPPRPTTPRPTPSTTTSTTTSTTSTTTPKPTTTSTTTSTTSTTSTTTTARPTRPPYRPLPPRYDRPTTRRPTHATPKPTRPDAPRPNPLPSVTVPAPSDPNIIEKDTDKDGGYEVDTGDIPKDRWTNVVGKDKPEDFDVNEVHCLYGYEKNAAGDCVDIDECNGRHICGALEMCMNKPGGYRCECIPGFQRDSAGSCAVIPTPTTPPTLRVVTSTTTELIPTSTELPHAPPPRNRPIPPLICEMGYTFDSNAGKCIDIDECATNRHTCRSTEKCINVEGGFNCEKPSYSIAPAPRPSRPRPSGDNVITVGAQYGQRGPRYMRPTFKRLPGEVEVSCPWGYSLTPDRICLDIDECARNVSECGPQQRCENFYGGYSCQCGAGHRLLGQAQCEDIDECQYGVPCSYSSKCINTIGSYRCECSTGFRNAASNDKVCVDIDECSETPNVCKQGCTNSWGSYRCHCSRGYKLDADGKTCVDIDECAEWKASGSRGRLCGGECVNQPGSYRCACPSGYRLSEDQHSCVDIDECETGTATCARSNDARQVCQNTRGSYHCHTITCPTGYQLEAKHRCSRIQRSCPMADRRCLHQPSSYSYNFITFVANIYLPMGSVDLFTMHGPAWSESFMSFEMRLVDVRAAPGVRPADLSCFDTRPTGNICVVSLLCSLAGPQVVELELTMSLYQRGQFAGSAVARLIVIVSEYEY